MATPSYFLLAVFLALVASHAIASDPSPLQDFCVADEHSPGIVYLSNVFSRTKSQITSIISTI
jgi:hypothetical protein